MMGLHQTEVVGQFVGVGGEPLPNVRLELTLDRPIRDGADGQLYLPERRTKHSDASGLVEGLFVVSNEDEDAQPANAAYQLVLTYPNGNRVRKRVSVPEVATISVFDLLNIEPGPDGPGNVGPPGPQGLRGEEGPEGPAGPEGPEGPIGLEGPQGPTGDTGPAGPQGEQGDQGEVGPQGPQGVQGPKGDTGDAGAQGPVGDTGPQGIQGETGPEGPQGEAGPQGPEGPVGPQGPEGPQGEVGSGLNVLGTLNDPSELPASGDAGDGYFIDGDLWVWDGSDWVNVGSVEGPEGPEGPQGPAGPQGATGDTGPQGPEGAEGPSGPQGPEGDQGPVGPQGPEGPEGPEGPPGPLVDHNELDGRSASDAHPISAITGLQGELDDRLTEAESNVAYYPRAAVDEAIDNATDDLQQQIEHLGSPDEQRAIDAEQNVRLWQLEADVIGQVEGMTGWQGEAFLTGQDEIESVAGDIAVSRAARLADGFVSIAASPLIGIEIGDPLMGGFFAGIIDTDANSGDIDPNDTRQQGKRYALIVSPKAIGEPSTELQWRDSRSGVAEARTRWDGLYVTDFIIDGNAGSLSSFPIFEFCSDVRASDPPPDDGGSDWYIPAMDELELLHRNFKPGTDSINTGSRSGTFPDGQYPDWGNPSSDPQGVSYATDPPTQTSVTAFQLGNAEALDYDGDARYWSATEAASDRAWRQLFRGSLAGLQNRIIKDSTTARCRLVRRVEL